MVTDNAFILHRLTYILVFKTYFLQYNDTSKIYWIDIKLLKL